MVQIYHDEDVDPAALDSLTVATVGFGNQGRSQALNLRDNGFKVIVGQSKKFMKDWNRAKQDGFVPGKTLFEIEEAVKRGTVVQYLLSDAAQKIC